MRILKPRLAVNGSMVMVACRVSSVRSSGSFMEPSGGATMMVHVLRRSAPGGVETGRANRYVWRW
jgi:hypothetical protein